MFTCIHDCIYTGIYMYMSLDLGLSDSDQYRNTGGLLINRNILPALLIYGIMCIIRTCTFVLLHVLLYTHTFVTCKHECFTYVCMYNRHVSMYIHNVLSMFIDVVNPNMTSRIPVW